MRTFFGAITWILALTFAPVGVAQSPTVPPVLHPLMDQLMAIDTVPTPQSLRAIDPNIEERLVEAAREPALNEYARARAVTLLSLFPTPETYARLLSLQAEPDDEIAAMALYVAARTFGSEAPELVFEITIQALQSPSKTIRKKAILATRWIQRPDDVRKHLQAQQRSETDPDLVRLVGRTLQKIKAAEQGPPQ